MKRPRLTVVQKQLSLLDKVRIGLWSEPDVPERRKKRRFKLVRQAKFKVASPRVMVGHGVVQNMSSTGLMVATETKIEPGMIIQVTIEWPVALDGKTPLNLIVNGEVRWVAGSSVGVQFDHHVFRTRATLRPVKLRPVT